MGCGCSSQQAVAPAGERGEEDPSIVRADAPNVAGRPSAVVKPEGPGSTLQGNGEVAIRIGGEEKGGSGKSEEKKEHLPEPAREAVPSWREEVLRRGPVSASAEPAGPRWYASADELGSAGDAEIMARWCRRLKEDDIPPEYRAAWERMSIDHDILRSSQLARFVEVMGSPGPSIQRWLKPETINTTMTRAFAKAWGATTPAALKSLTSDVPEISEGLLWPKVLDFFKRLPNGDKLPAQRAMQVLIENVDSVQLRMMICVLHRGSIYCQAATAHAFSTLMHNTASALDEAQTLVRRCSSAAEASEALALDAARARLRGLLVSYIDEEIKPKAFASAFIEPARLVYDGIDQLDVHAVNWYSGLLAATLGVQLRHNPHFSDNCVNGMIEFQLAAETDAMKLYLLPDNFGKSALVVPKELRDEAVGVCLPTKHKFIWPLSTVRVLANASIDPTPANAGNRAKLAPYLERFARFFSEDFLLERLFMRLISDNGGLKPDLDLVFQHMHRERVLGKPPVPRRNSSMARFLGSEHGRGAEEAGGVEAGGASVARGAAESVAVGVKGAVDAAEEWRVQEASETPTPQPLASSGPPALSKLASVRYWVYDDDTFEFRPGRARELLHFIGGVLRPCKPQDVDSGGDGEGEGDRQEVQTQ